MGTREDHANDLRRASAMLLPVNDTSVRPAQLVRPAYEIAKRCHAEMGYMQGRDLGKLRVGVLQLQGVLRALDADEPVREGDYAAVHKAAAALREVATLAVNDSRTPKRRVDITSMPNSSVGLRFTSLSDLSDAKPFITLHQGRQLVPEAAHEDVSNNMGEVDEARERMPRLKRNEPFATFRCPLVVYTKYAVGKSALDRAGLTWRRLAGGNAVMATGLPPIGNEGVNALLFENQLLVGFDRARRRADKTYVTQVTDQLQHRLGPLTPPLGERARYLVSPGNPLDWLWLVPSRVLASVHLMVTEAAFPWRTDEVVLTEAQRKAHEREVEQINDQQGVLAKQGLGIDVHALTRQSDLMEKLDRNAHRPGMGAPDLAKRRMAMQQAIDKRTKTLVSQIVDLKQQIVDVGGKGSLIKPLKDDVKRLQARVTAITEEEMRKARAELERK